MSNRVDDYSSSHKGTAAASDRASPGHPSIDTSSMYLYSKQGFGAGGLSAAAAAAAAAAKSLYGGAAFDDSLASGTKRSLEALYRQTILGSHNSIGQNEALFSSNSLIKCPRLETGSNLPIYPQRPGAKDCAYYMMTRTCKFGDACKFDHPIWVPEGGIPDWKEVQLVPTTEFLPERPGEPDCPYYMKTQKCKYGVRCKFNHPKEKLNASTSEFGEEYLETTETTILPERPSEPICSFYMKTGKCKFGASCKFHHPKDLVPLNEQNGKQDSTMQDGLAKTYVPFTPALLHNSKGLPIRPGQIDCTFYLKTGSCKYGSTCCYNHPDRYTINRFIAGIGQTILPSATANYSIGVLNPAANFLQMDLQAQASLGIFPAIYPQRPGEMECDFYMKTGHCKFGESCKYHHPFDRSVQLASQQAVVLTLDGLPRREGAAACSFYMKTGTCKFGATCRFDHPPLGVAISAAPEREQKDAAVP